MGPYEAFQAERNVVQKRSDPVYLDSNSVNVCLRIPFCRQTNQSWLVEGVLPRSVAEKCNNQKQTHTIANAAGSKHASCALFTHISYFIDVAGTRGTQGKFVSHAKGLVQDLSQELPPMLWHPPLSLPLPLHEEGGCSF